MSGDTNNKFNELYAIVQHAEALKEQHTQLSSQLASARQALQDAHQLLDAKYAELRAAFEVASPPEEGRDNGTA